MAKLTKEQIESVSVLIEACRGIGAIYHENKIVFADGSFATLEDQSTFWRFSFRITYKDLGKHYSVKLLKIKLLQIHIKILEEFN